MRRVPLLASYPIDYLFIFSRCRLLLYYCNVGGGGKRKKKYGELGGFQQYCCVYNKMHAVEIYKNVNVIYIGHAGPYRPCLYL